MFDRLIEFVISILTDVMCWFVVNVFDMSLILRGGKPHRVRGPGIYWKIPFLDQPQTHTVITTTLSIPVQSLITKDGEHIAAKAMVKFNIDDITAYVENIYDATDAIQDLTQAKIMLIINARTFEESRNTEDVSNEITKKVRAEVKKYGIYVEQVTLTDFAKTPSYRIFADQGLCLSSD